MATFVHGCRFLLGGGSAHLMGKDEFYTSQVHISGPKERKSGLLQCSSTLRQTKIPMVLQVLPKGIGGKVVQLVP